MESVWTTLVKLMQTFQAAFCQLLNFHNIVQCEHWTKEGKIYQPPPIHAGLDEIFHSGGFGMLTAYFSGGSIIKIRLAVAWPTRCRVLVSKSSHKCNAPRLSQSSPSQPVMFRFSCTSALPQNPATSAIHHFLQLSHNGTRVVYI